MRVVANKIVKLEKLGNLYGVDGGRWQRTPWRVEATFVTDDMAELAHLRARVIASGHSEAVANGLIGWLVAKNSGQHGGSSTATRYRRILEQLVDDEAVRSLVA